MLRRLFARLSALWHRDRYEADLHDELDFHLSEETDERVAAGLAPDEARRAAHREFGNVMSVRARTRDVRVWPWWQDLDHDLRFAVRMLVKRPWLTTTAVLTLGLAFSVNTAMFTFVNAWVVRDLPVPEPDRLVNLNTLDERGRPLGTSVPDYEDWRTLAASFSDLAAVYDGQSVNLGDDVGLPERARSAYVTANTFRLIGQAPVLGRDFANLDEAPDAPAVAIIGHGLWQSRYAADPAVVGQTLRANGTVVTIIGVMAPTMQFPSNIAIWMPLAQVPSDLPSADRSGRFLRVFGRLQGGVSVEQALAELTSIGEQLAARHPVTNGHVAPALIPFAQAVRGGDTLPAMFAQGLVVFVLLIAGANVANLLLVRATRRSGEISIRASLGASRWRVVRQLLVESVVLASIAGVVGIALSIPALRWWLNAAVRGSSPYGLPYDFPMDGVVWAFVTGIYLVTIAFGLAPALLASKTDLNAVLKEGGRDGPGGRRGRRWMSALVVGELALTLTLLGGAGFLVRSVISHRSTDLGIDPGPLLTMRISMVPSRYAEPGPRGDVFRQLEARLGGISAIEASAMATSAPFQFGEPRTLAIDGQPAPALEMRLTITRMLVGDAYFDTVGVPMLAGRAFTPADGVEGRDTAIVNRRFVETHFGGADAIGRRIRLSPIDQPEGAREDAWLTIVGVAPNIRQVERAPAQVPLVYQPYRTEYRRSGDLIVRARAGDPADLAPLVLEAMRAIDPDVAFFNVWTLERLLAERRSETRFVSSVLTALALFALVLSAVGLYAITAHAVNQRTREIGLRMALGARPGQIRQLVLGRAVRQLAIGLALGAAGALGMGQALRSGIYVVRPTDPTTLVAVVTLLSAAALVACLVPARRAARVDPMVALRHE